MQQQMPKNKFFVPVPRGRVECWSSAVDDFLNVFLTRRGYFGYLVDDMSASRLAYILILLAILSFPFLSAAESRGEWKGNRYEERRHPQLKYDEYGQVDPSPDVVPLEYLPRDNFGFVDWSKAMRQGLIQPRSSISPEGAKEEQTVLYNEDVVLRPSKVFMPDVIFPHDAHNQWLNCGNCHPGIFRMKKKASGITMVRIWKGEFCGRCHDKVAFPLRNCFRCHAGERAMKFR